MTPLQTTKDVVHRSFEALNDQDRDAFVDLHAADAVVHAAGGSVVGIDAIVAEEFAYFDAFPDFTYAVDGLVAEGDLVSARWTASGTHEGAFNGIAPTGEAVEITVMGTFRVEDERIVEVWVVPDRLALMQQLGVVDLPQA